MRQESAHSPGGSAAHLPGGAGQSQTKGRPGFGIAPRVPLVPRGLDVSSQLNLERSAAGSLPAFLPLGDFGDRRGIFGSCRALLPRSPGLRLANLSFSGLCLPPPALDLGEGPSSGLYLTWGTTAPKKDFFGEESSLTIRRQLVASPAVAAE